MNLKKELNKGLQSTVVIGRVYGKFSGNGPIIVAACSMDEGKKIAHYTLLHDSGEYELLVDRGRYHVFAYWDKNSNLIYDAGEPAGQYGDPKPVCAPAVGVVFDIDIVIPEEGGNIEIPSGTEIASVKPPKLYSRQAGAIADLDDERFSEENGIKGFWEPLSIATPWGGDKMAEYGVRQSPVVIPCWIDMQPDGDFIQSLYRKAMPESVSFYMFSGYKGDRNPFRSNNDGTITMASLLDYRPQSEAEMNYTFNEDHESILSSKDVIAQYNTILDKFDEKQSASLRRSRGYIKIHFAYNYEFEGVRPQPMFILRPVGKKDAVTVTYLSDYDNNRIIGPFPYGDYLASMIAVSGKTTKKYVPVSIDSNQTKELDFVFIPDGVIRGCVTASLKPEDKAPGRPDYVYRSLDKKINIQSIALKGSGVQRVLEPVDGEDIADHDCFISRNDYCRNTCFSFFGLPAGDYKLIIKAQGYKPIVKYYSVSPGIPKYFRMTELTPDRNFCNDFK